MSKKKNINWINLLFITITSLLGIVGTALLITFGLVPWQTWILAIIMFIFCGISVTAGYHRLAAHKSYKATWPVRLFFTLFGAGAFEGSVAEWATDHRNHHRYTDTEKDPYNIKQGFWYAHIGWLFTLDYSKRDFSNVKDLLEDPIYRLQHRFYPFVATLVGFILPMLIAMCWNDPLGGLIVAGAFRITVLYQSTFFINSLCHTFGKQTFKNSSARDHWITALLTFGEGFHNFHHQFPIDYRNGIRFFHFDPTKWLIYLLSCLRLASGLKRVEQHRMIKYRLNTETNRLASVSEEVLKVTRPLTDKIHQLLNRFEELEKNYLTLKKEKLKKTCKNRLLEARQRLKETKRELDAHLSLWSKIIHQARDSSPLVSNS